MTDYKLADVEELARKNPDTFKILPKKTRENLSVGDGAKLCFSFKPVKKDGPDGERMWVQIVTKGDDETYIGTLANIPTIAPGLKLGDMIYFRPSNVLQVLPKTQYLSVARDPDDGQVDYTHKNCNDPDWKE